MTEEAPLPVDEPVLLPDVKAWLGIDDADDDTALELIVTAVCVLVRGLPVADRSRGRDTWPATVKLGSVMLCARLWRRKDTPGGIEAFGDFGVAYVRRNDPDVAAMLELGEQSRPSVG